MSLYRREFPDYDDMLRVPDGFKDASYHNDVCPHVERVFTNGETEIRHCIWQDYVDPDRREWSNTKRFILLIEVNNDVVFDYATDTWSEIENLIPHLTIMRFNGWREE